MSLIIPFTFGIHSIAATTPSDSLPASGGFLSVGYLKKDELPAVVAIACRALVRDKHVFAAHYVPARKMAGHVG
jgi:hypothetical protein